MFDLLLLLLSAVMIFLIYAIFRPKKNTKYLPPSSTPSLPLFGNALHYKHHPAIFLVDQAKKHGAVFSLNLAGMKTTILTSKETLRQFSHSPETILSSRFAVSDFGFRYTLGDYNVFHGTDIHKSIIKSKYSSINEMNQAFNRILISIDEILRTEIKNSKGSISDIITFIRKVILLAISWELIGKSVIEIYNSKPGQDFLIDFMLFQDCVEDVTAKAAVLPTWLALPICLWKSEVRRKCIVSKIDLCFKELWSKQRIESMCKFLKKNNY